MKKKIIVTLLLIFLLLLSFIIFFVISNFTNKKDTITGPLSGKIYYTNADGDEYIKFLSDSIYEMRQKTDDDLYKTIKGKYTYSDDNTILFDDNKEYMVQNGKIVSNEKLIYFNNEKLTDELINLRKVVIEYVDDIKKGNPNLAYPKNVRISLNECYLNNSNSIICGIDYNIYFDNYIKSVCDELEKDKMFFPYTYSNGYCENNYISNFLYFEVKEKNGNYELLKTYNNI